MSGLEHVASGAQHSGPDWALRTYLGVLAGGAPSTAFLELRHRVGPQQLVAEFFGIEEQDRLAAAIRTRAKTRDVYVGCAPRDRREGTKRAVSEVWTLWAECDGDAAFAAVRAFQPRPAVVVASGTGANCHAYWPLREAVPPWEAEAANLRLAHALGADPVCFDAARILRPPGTRNHKRRPPTPVTLLRVEPEQSFALNDVVGELPEREVARIERRWAPQPARSGHRDRLLAIPPAVYVADLLGQEIGRNAKVRCPFHGDEHPSLHVYSTAARGWSCFSCGRGGSIYDLAAGVWGLGTRGRAFIELRQRLLDHFPEALARSLSVER